VCPAALAKHTSSKAIKKRPLAKMRALISMLSSLQPSCEYIVDIPHDPLSPLHRSSNQFVDVGAPTRCSEQIARSSHVHRREDRGHDSEHAFAAFVRDGKPPGPTVKSASTYGKDCIVFNSAR
jgi:hypothetical protein